MNIQQRVLEVFKGSFLVSDKAAKNWRFIIFLAFLAFIMISSGHRLDAKLHRIKQLNKEINVLRSDFFVLKRGASLEIRILTKRESKIERFGCLQGTTEKDRSHKLEWKQRIKKLSIDYTSW